MGSDPTYRLTVTYAAGHDQEHPGLTADRLETGTGAFLHDLTYLKGEGITRLVAEIEPVRPRAEADESVWSYVARRAIENASYALNPNQGERPDPSVAAMWLRTTYPLAHPNYVSPGDPLLAGTDYAGRKDHE